MRQVSGILLGALVVAGCAATTGNGAAHPFGRSSSFSTRNLADGKGQALLFTNRESYPVELLTLSLRDCQNVSGGCKENMPLSGRLEPGQTAEVLIVVALDPTEPMSYKPFARSRRLRRR